MIERKIWTVAVSLAAALLAGCVTPIPSLPTTPDEYDALRRTNPDAYPPRVILMRNVQRVLDEDLPGPERMDSLSLVARLGDLDLSAATEITAVLGQGTCPPELHAGVLQYLLTKNVPGLASYVVQGLSTADRSTGLQSAMLEWLIQHPNPTILAEVVKLWAHEPSKMEPNEWRYRHLIEQMTGKKWEQALLDKLNAPVFYARGSALQILVQRIEPGRLRRLISAMPPRSDAIAGVQSFIDLFDYVPAGGRELLLSVCAYKFHRDAMSRAASLSLQWSRMYGYRFNIRDFPLLAGLASDPLRKSRRQAGLLGDLTGILGSRRHAAGSAGASDFRSQSVLLSMSDLWNLHLLNEMLSRPRTKLALQTHLNRNRSGGSASEGLVFYHNGEAGPRLYAPAGQGGPSPQFVKDSRYCLSRFRNRFKSAMDSAAASPSIQELLDARNGNFYGLILTAIDKTSFSAHYYNPRGAVVSLGIFAFGE